VPVILTQGQADKAIRDIEAGKSCATENKLLSLKLEVQEARIMGKDSANAQLVKRLGVAGVRYEIVDTALQQERHERAQAQGRFQRARKTNFVLAGTLAILVFALIAS
jgi:hypothetical protein